MGLALFVEARVVAWVGEDIRPICPPLVFGRLVVSGCRIQIGVIADTVRVSGTYLDEMGQLAFDDIEFAVYHGTSEPLIDALVDTGS